MAEYIEREALIARLQKVCVTDDVFGMGMQCGTENAINCTKEAPAADVVEVRHGEWLPVTYTHFGAKRYECSVCRDDEFWEKRYIEIKENYCPNCGARMDAERK